MSNTFEDILNMSYGDYIDLLKDKYGEVCMRDKPYMFYHDWRGEWVDTTKRTTSRTDEGLTIHNIHEDLKPLNLEKDASSNKKKVYCNAIEHCLLRLKIVEARLENDKENLYGLGLTGLLSKCSLVNGYYNDLPKEGWQVDVANKIIDDYDIYIQVMKRAKDIIENSQLIERCPEPLLAYDWDGRLVERIYDDIYGGELVITRDKLREKGWAVSHDR